MADVIFWSVYASFFVLLLGAVGWAAAGIASAAQQGQRDAFEEGQQAERKRAAASSPVADPSNT